MATFNAAGYAQSQVDGPSKADPGLKNARVKTIIDEYTLLADLAVDDVIQSFSIPAKAKVINAYIALPASLGGSCTLDLGWLASEDDDISEAADADGFLDGIDATSATKHEMPTTRPGYHKRFAKPVQIQVQAKAVSSSATGEKIIMGVEYTE